MKRNLYISGLEAIGLLLLILAMGYFLGIKILACLALIVIPTYHFFYRRLERVIKIRHKGAQELLEVGDILISFVERNTRFLDDDGRYIKEVRPEFTELKSKFFKIGDSLCGYVVCKKPKK